ncbi:MAG: Na+/H+ antiporter subunit C [Longimicrobiales bacterium]|nr:Na+/H+ antiporter subunit C [Longimicrobiales bacterium]
MELLVTLSVGVLVAGGVFLILRPRTFSTILGLSLLSYAANLFIFASSYIRTGLAPLASIKDADFPDPLPQALVLTAIVISFGMTGFVVVLGLRAHTELGSDHVDGAEPEAAPGSGAGAGAAPEGTA